MTTGTILFNPFTGRPRHPSDIASDPKGLLIWDGEEPLRTAQPSQAVELSDEEIQTIYLSTYNEGHHGRNLETAFARAIIAVINAKESGK